MTVDASAGAALIVDEEQLGLFRVESARPVTAPLVWRDPPPDRRVVLTPGIVEQLRGCPGRWAAVREYRSLTAAKGRAHLVKHPVDIELRGVSEPPGSVLYARAKPSGGAR
jgi:hypothetical protein